MNKLLFATICSTAVLSACSSAPKSNEVSAAYVPVSQYSNYTCEQLLSEVESVRRSVPSLEAAVDKHRENQNGVEVITWVLFWPAAFALDKGEGTSSQLGKAKGELQALQTALMTKKCDGASTQQVASASASAATPRDVAPRAVAAGGTDQSMGLAVKLRELDAVRKEGVITEDEYRQKRKEILDRL